MFRNIIKITLRNLIQDRLYSYINILGLSISFACFLIIFLYLRNEVTVDQHFDNHENIYRLTSESVVDGVQTSHAKVGAMVGPLLAQDYPEFGSFVRLNPLSLANSILVLRGDAGIQWDTAYRADNSVFDVFSHDVIAGNPDTALTEPRTIAISESVARLYFGEENPLGQTLGIQTALNEFTVDLVFADLPENSSLKYDMLFYYSERPPELYAENFFEYGIVRFDDYTYFRLSEDFDLSRIDSISDEFFDLYVAGPAQRMFPGAEASIDYKLQPLEDIYFSPFYDEDVPKGNRFNIYALSVIAVFIVLISNINYMNLSTARFSKRAREVGVRRTLGASKSSLVMQFLFEGMTFSLISLLIGISLVELVLAMGLIEKYFNIAIPTSLAADPVLFIQLILVSVSAGLISGAYPALYFSSVRPVQIFKPLAKSGKEIVSMRGLLLSIQMLISTAVIASALIMALQINFLQQRPLGFEKENKMIIHINYTYGGAEFRTLVNELASHPEVYNAAMAEYAPGTVTASQPVLMRTDEGGEITHHLNWFVVDEHYLDTLKIPLLQGRNFETVDLSSDLIEQNQYIVNEALVSMMGWENPIGQRLEFQVNGVNGVVIGVMGNFNFQSLREEVQPLSLEPFYDDYRWQRKILLDFNPQALEQIIPHVESVMTAFSLDTPFEYSLLDQSLESLYGEEEKQFRMILFGSVICIMIALLGLFGLTAFTMDQKTKEIGIRRILGASTVRIMSLLFEKVFWIILGSSFFASAMTYYFLTLWLQLYAYRIDINVTVFLLSTSIVLGLAMVTVVVQAMRILRDKPVNSLRDE